MSRDERGPGKAVARVEDVDGLAKQILLPRKGSFARILPSTVDADAFIGLTVAALYKAPKTAEVAMRVPESLLVAMRECASLGLMPNTDEYAFTVRDGRILGLVQYQGEIKRMFMFGTVESVHAEVICKGEWLERRDPDSPIHNVPSGWENRDKSVSNLVGAYAYAVFHSGRCSRIIHMGRDEIFKHRAMAGFTAIWDGDFGHTMWTKTCVHELEKWVPKSSSFMQENARAMFALSQEVRGQGPTQEYGDPPVRVPASYPEAPAGDPFKGASEAMHAKVQREPVTLDGDVVEPPQEDPWAGIPVAKPGGEAK